MTQSFSTATSRGAHPTRFLRRVASKTVRYPRSSSHLVAKLSAVTRFLRRFPQVSRLRPGKPPIYAVADLPS